MAMTEPRPGARGRPRRPMLTLETVIEAAARVLQRDGYDGLTMRAIADDLGVQAPALYWYVATKEELETRLYEHLMGDLRVTFPQGDWRETLRSVARQYRAHMRRFRDLTHLVPHRYFHLGQETLSMLDDGLGMLRAAGLSDRDAAYAQNTLLSYVVLYVAGEAGAPEPGSARALLADDLAALEPGEYPNVVALGEHLAAQDRDGRFEFGLDCLISGLEAIAARRP